MVIIYGCKAIKTLSPEYDIRYLNVDSFIDSTLVDRIWKNGAVVSSDFVVSHLSDVLRFLVLRRFGGIYVDSDVVFLKPLPDVFNFVGRESWTHPFVGTA